VSETSAYEAAPGAGDYPVYLALLPLPIACFVGVLITDIVYWWTYEMMWADFSAWLLVIGVILGLIAIVAVLIRVFRDRYVRRQGLMGPFAASGIVALILAVFNLLIHSRDAWTSVVPSGLILSCATVAVSVVCGCLAWCVAPRNRGARL